MSPISALGARLETDVLAARAGDALAFGRLVDETKSAVTAIALAIVGDFPASQDIAQDVFFAAWRNLGKLRSPSSFLPWLRQTTRNRARTWLRDQGRRRLAGTQIDQLLPEVAGAGPDPSDLIVEREERRLVVEALADRRGPGSRHFGRLQPLRSIEHLDRSDVDLPDLRVGPLVDALRLATSHQRPPSRCRAGGGPGCRGPTAPERAHETCRLRRRTPCRRCRTHRRHVQVRLIAVTREDPRAFANHQSGGTRTGTVNAAIT